jgi:hypothetical protein
VNSDTSITAKAPPGHVPFVQVIMTGPGGTSPTSESTKYRYGPAIAVVNPTAGVGSGGTKVTITGNNFSAVTAADFGSTPATVFNVETPKKTVAISPAGTGLVDITVVNPVGTSPVVPTDHYDYAPTVITLFPNHGRPTGGQKITITGTNFTGVTAVDFGSNAAQAFTVNSTTHITATSPKGTGIVDVTVASLGGTSPASANDKFTY